MKLESLRHAVGPAGVEPQAAVPVIIGVVVLLYAGPAQ